MRYLLITLVLFPFIFCCSNERDRKITKSLDKPPATKSTSPGILPFGHDFYAAGINLYDNERDIKRVLGSPKEKHVEKCEHMPVCATFIFPFGVFKLEGEKEDCLYVTKIILSSPGVFGPRQTQVGEDIYAVIRKFPDENHPIQNKERKLYGDVNKIYDKSLSNRRWEELGFGVVTYNDRGEIIEVMYSDGRVGFGSHWLRYKVDKGKVTEISISIQNI